MVLNSVDMPIIMGYEEGVRIHDSIVPYRSGSERGRRPLGKNRRYKECLIEHDKEEGVVIARLYDYPVLKYWKDGTIDVCLFYDSATTRQFIFGASRFSTKVVRSQTYLLTPNGEAFKFKGNTHVLSFDADYRCKNPETDFRYKLNRKAYAEVKERYRGFTEYVKHMLLVVDRLTDQDVHAMTGAEKLQKITLPSARPYFHVPNVTKGKRELLADYVKTWEAIGKEDNLEKLYVEFVRVFVSAVRYNWYHKEWRFENGETKDKLIEFIHEALKYYHAEEVFTREEVAQGTLVDNANRKYFA